MSTSQSVSVTLKLDRALAQIAAKRFFSRKFGAVGFLALAVILASFLVGLIFAPGHVATWFIGALLLLAVTLVPLAYRSIKNATLQMVELLGDDPRVELTATAEGLILRMADEPTEVLWEELDTLWLFDDVWLLFVDRGSFLVLPRDQLSAAFCELLLERMRRHHVRVK
ncbi:MAG: hypothetical protein KC609_25915 [Myxococcales bacterium]|nr:hypothetical protein [Myxococcales bacterium]